MDEIGTCHTAESSNCTFSHTVLMFCTGSTEVKILVLTDAVLSKLVRAEDTIVRVVLFDRYATAPSFCLNTLLAKDGAGSRKISLQLVKDLGTGVVDKHGSVVLDGCAGV